ncbi:MAG: demethoxyubiquinone hydroxylase family protein [Pseudomonadota bacterium]
MADDNKHPQTKSRSDILKRLPGMHTPQTIQHEMLRVDHAGEFGAVGIYRGQKDALKHATHERQSYENICHMAEGEDVHLAHFNKILPERRIRPSLFSPFWARGSYILGSVTALISKNNAMACTEAVETVIGAHYNEQIDFFEAVKDPETEALKKFRDDELEHLDEAVSDGAQQASVYRAANGIVQSLCKGVITIAEKI